VQTPATMLAGHGAGKTHAARSGRGCQLWLHGATVVAGRRSVQRRRGAKQPAGDSKQWMRGVSICDRSSTAEAHTSCSQDATIKQRPKTPVLQAPCEGLRCAEGRFRSSPRRRPPLTKDYAGGQSWGQPGCWGSESDSRETRRGSNWLAHLLALNTPAVRPRMSPTHHQRPIS
jgi:hypothetical protein